MKMGNKKKDEQSIITVVRKLKDAVSKERKYTEQYMYTVEREVGVLKIKPQERNQRVHVEKRRKFTGDLYICMYTVQVQVKDGKEAAANPPHLPEFCNLLEEKMALETSTESQKEENSAA